MPVKIVSPSEATGRLKEIYDEITRTIGQVPFPLQVLSVRPDLLEARWRATRETRSQSLLSRKEACMISFEVARADGCAFCREQCTGELRAVGLDDEEIEALGGELKQAKFDERTKNVLIFSYSIAQDPHNKDNVVMAFKGLGLSDEDILDVAALVNTTRATFGLIHSLGFHSK